MNIESIDCEEVMKKLWDYLDGELSPTKMQTIAAHIAMCARCYPQYQFERAFLEAIATAHRGVAAPAGMRERLITSLQEAGLKTA